MSGFRTAMLTVAMGILSACSGGEGPDRGVSEWSFSSSADTVTLDHGNSDHVVASLTDLVQWRGHLTIVDRMEHNVKVYDRRTGELLTVLGRRGAGPGEFIYPMGAAPLPDGALAVHDALLSRVTVFDSLGAEIATWRLPGNFGSGIDALPSGDLILPGRITADRQYVSDSAIHHFTRRGEYVRAYLVVPELEHFGENALNQFSSAVVDSTLVALQRTSNEALLVDLRSDAIRADSLGKKFYRPIQWTLEPGVSAPEEEEWLREQMIAWWVRGLGDGIYAAGFSEWGDSVGDWRARWVFGSPATGPFATSEPTDATPAFIRDGRLYSVRVPPDGRVEMLIGEAPRPK